MNIVRAFFGFFVLLAMGKAILMTIRYTSPITGKPCGCKDDKDRMVNGRCFHCSAVIIEQMPHNDYCPHAPNEDDDT